MQTASKIDIDALARLLVLMADNHIVPYFRNLKAEDIETKSHANDFVTRADKETEIALTKALHTMVPGCTVIGEEAVSAGLTTTDALNDPKQVIFVLDPVDGTSNFKNGSVTFGEMMSVVVNGEVVAGFIYDVMSGTMYIAVKGEGAYRLPRDYSGSYKDGERLRVSDGKDLDTANGFLAPYYFPPAARPFLRTAVNGRFQSLHCSAHEYINVASGKAEFVVVNHMKPWDHLAGALMVQEAGGVAAKFDGSKYLPGDETGGIIVANNPAIMKQLSDKIVNPVVEILRGPSP
ncbi:MAG: Inositol-monophosphatase [Micavibrio sp.]|nr:Inositol-monophosphatase [Micavibrio sp.]